MILKEGKGVCHTCVSLPEFQVSSGRWFGRLINFKGGMVFGLKLKKKGKLFFFSERNRSIVYKPDCLARIHIQHRIKECKGEGGRYTGERIKEEKKEEDPLITIAFPEG